MKNKRFTQYIYAIMRPAILVGFSAFILTKVANKQIMLFIHPRFIPLAVFTGIVLLLLALVEAHGSITKKSGSHGTLKTTTAAIFIAPLLFGVVFPPVSMDSAMARKKGGINVASQQKRQPREKAIADKQQGEKDTVEITDKNFITRVSGIYDKPDAMEGKKIHLTGFIYKEDDFKKNQFAIVRFAISCCTADATPAGFICNHPEAEKFKTDTWYDITGRIVLIEADGDKIPAIDVTKYNQVKPLKDQYVYPDWYDPSTNKK